MVAGERIAQQREAAVVSAKAAFSKVVRSRSVFSAETAQLLETSLHSLGAGRGGGGRGASGGRGGRGGDASPQGACAPTTQGGGSLLYVKELELPPFSAALGHFSAATAATFFGKLWRELPEYSAKTTGDGGGGGAGGGGGGSGTSGTAGATVSTPERKRSPRSPPAGTMSAGGGSPEVGGWYQGPTPARCTTPAGSPELLWMEDALRVRTGAGLSADEAARLRAQLARPQTPSADAADAASPACGLAAIDPRSKGWHLFVEGTSTSEGPYDGEALRARLVAAPIAGALQKVHLWRSGMSGWMIASELLGETMPEVDHTPVTGMAAARVTGMAGEVEYVGEVMGEPASEAAVAREKAVRRSAQSARDAQRSRVEAAESARDAARAELEDVSASLASERRERAALAASLLAVKAQLAKETRRLKTPRVIHAQSQTTASASASAAAAAAASAAAIASSSAAAFRLKTAARRTRNALLARRAHMLRQVLTQVLAHSSFSYMAHPTRSR